MKLIHKVAIAGAVGVAVAVTAKYCWNWWKKGDKVEEKKEGPEENDDKEISFVPASEKVMIEEIPLIPESGSLKEEKVKANPVMESDSETIKEAVKEIPLAPRSLTHYKEEKPQLGIYRFEVDGIGQLEAIINTGTEICIVRRDALPDSIVSKIISLADDAFILPGGSKLGVLGYVFLSVSYVNQTVKLPFLVLADSCLFPMVLGNNWIRKSRAILQSDGRKLAVTFGGKKERMGCKPEYCSSPYVLVDVDGIGKARALVSTGSKVSSIRRDMLTEFQKSNAAPAPDTATMANNPETTEVLETISLSITFQGIATYIENIHIASKMEDQLALGMDWIDKTRAVIQSDGTEIIVSQPDSRP